ncbi:UDP-N-acetylglucosamine 1-carboxyvinyltransferase [Candidatus Peregrinibacteria bacterium]|jgi:UDP-N-acetylglucosamine 1-carboxyvinyltransferase|nr:UDP-N-acetylglucosamine 1-carboxyvinyltransferase [Candidatus Peregrinibacteria bacterium]
MSKLIIQGGKPLSGEVKISGSKNAALPIISACLLSSEVSTLKNVPDISDIHTLIKILEFLEVKVEFQNNTLEIDPKDIKNKQIPHELVDKMRGSIILLAPLLARFGEVKLSFPGGCVLGKRPIDSHLLAFENLEAEVLDSHDSIHLKTKKLQGKQFSMSEMSVTATENAIIAACLASGESVIKLCAAEPHVQDLCHALNDAGAKISGIGTHFLSIEGVSSIQGVRHEICSDYLEVGTYALAAALTGGHIIIKNAIESHLDSFWEKMKEAGVKFEHRENEVEVFPSPHLKSVNIRTAVHPSFPTDLQAQFSVLLTQCEGQGSVFETLFEGKMNYVFELEKMGARVVLTNSHQAIIFGKTQLKACPVASLDIRAGAAMVLAALVADGETEISQINYIERGYSNLVEKLQGLGAQIVKTAA